jgi:UDP-2,3-diacylglucosamine hydrolase
MVIDQALIISDIHLTPAYPHTAKRFIDFCQVEARKTPCLFIIGDLFEFWVGDDAHLHSPFHKEIANEIKQVVDSGVLVYFIPGNRDFMLGSAFAKLATWQVLPDPSIIQVGSKKWVLTHGDNLCTADPAYQLFRGITRLQFLQRLFMLIPTPIRKKMGAQLRQRATIKYQLRQHFNPQKANIKGNVTLQACAKILRKNHCNQLIHGHTHLPGIHQETQGQQEWTRWVLSDWDLDHPEMHPRASALQIDHSGVSVINLIR